MYYTGNGGGYGNPGYNQYPGNFNYGNNNMMMQFCKRN